MYFDVWETLAGAGNLRPATPVRAQVEYAFDKKRRSRRRDRWKVAPGQENWNGEPASVDAVMFRTLVRTLVVGLEPEEKVLPKLQTAELVWMHLSESVNPTTAFSDVCEAFTDLTELLTDSERIRAQRAVFDSMSRFRSESETRQMREDFRRSDRPPPAVEPTAGDEQA